MTVTQKIQPQVSSAHDHLRRVLAELARLSKSDISAREFYSALLNRIIESLVGTAGAIWILGRGGLELAYQVNFRATGLVGSDRLNDLVRHQLLLEQIAESGQPDFFPPASRRAPGNGPANLTDLLVLACPLTIGHEVTAIVEVLQRPEDCLAGHDGPLQFLRHACDIAQSFFRGQEIKKYADREALWARLDKCISEVHQSLSLPETAHTIAHEGRGLIQCDRLSVLAQKRGRLHLEAISGQDGYDRRSPTVRMLDRLANLAAAAGETLWYTGSTDHLPPEVESALLDYVDETDVKEMAIMPLFRKIFREREQPQIIGALVVEQFTGSCQQSGMPHRIDAVSQHAAIALAHAVDCRGSLLPLWRTWRASRAYESICSLPRLGLAGIAFLLAVSALLLPVDFNVAARGTLQPPTRNIFATSSGEIAQIFVEHGENVRAGQKLLVIANRELDQELIELRSKLSSIREHLDSQRRLRADGSRAAANRDDAVTRIQGLNVDLQHLEKTLSLLQREKERLVLESPIEGKVVTWDVGQRLSNRSVQRGDLLLEVADPHGSWHLELLVPEHRIGHLDHARATDGDVLVTYMLANEPSRLRTGRLIDVQQLAQPRGEENIVLVQVEVDSADVPAEPRIGITASAKIDCGKRVLGYVLFHDVWDFIRRIWFRIV